jgi:hypothetical protein
MTIPQNTVCVTEDGYFAKESYIIYLIFSYILWYLLLIKWSLAFLPASLNKN